MYINRGWGGVSSDFSLRATPVHLLYVFGIMSKLSVGRIPMSYSVYGPGVNDVTSGSGYYFPGMQGVLLSKKTNENAKPDFVWCAWVIDDTKGRDTDPRQFPHVRFNRLSIKLFKTEIFPGEEHVPHATLCGTGASNENDTRVYGRLITLATREALGLSRSPGEPRTVLCFSQVKDRLSKFLAEEAEEAEDLAWCSQHSTPAAAREGDSAY